jgi:hypothetical protein
MLASAVELHASPVAVASATGDQGRCRGDESAHEMPVVIQDAESLADKEKQAQNALLALERERVQREETFVQALQDQRIRMEPLGIDRHAREYRIFPGSPGEIVAIQRACREGNESRSTAVSYTGVEQLEALIEWLSDKSLTEQPLRDQLSLHLHALRRDLDHRRGGRGAERAGAEQQEAEASIVIETWDEGRCWKVGEGHAGKGMLDEERDVSESMPPFLQGVRHLTQRFSVCAGMSWCKEGLDIVKAHLLALENTCRWSYLAHWGDGSGVGEREDEAWVKIDKLVRGWVVKKETWQRRVRSSVCVPSVVTNVLALVHLLESLVEPAVGAVGGRVGGRVVGGRVVGLAAVAAAQGPSNAHLASQADAKLEAASLPAFWTSATLADTWYALLGLSRSGAGGGDGEGGGRGGGGQATVASMALAVLILGDEVGAYLRMLLALRFGMLGYRLRVMCWTEDVGRDEWHTCAVSHVRVPLLASCAPAAAAGGQADTKQSTPASPRTTGGAMTRRHHLQHHTITTTTNAKEGSGAAEGSARTNAASGCLLRIQHRVVWDEDAEDEWLFLPNESFQVWKPREWWAAQRQRSHPPRYYDGGWADAEDTEMGFLTKMDASWG